MFTELNGVGGVVIVVVVVVVAHCSVAHTEPGQLVTRSGEATSQTEQTRQPNT